MLNSIDGGSMTCQPEGSERLEEMVRWMDHFEAAKEVPIHTVTLDVGSLDVTRWWCDFFVELGVLDEREKVFMDLRCSQTKHRR